MKKKKNKDINSVKIAVSKHLKSEDSPIGSAINKIRKVVRKEARRIAKEQGVNPQRVLAQFDKIKLDIT